MNQLDSIAQGVLNCDVLCDVCGKSKTIGRRAAKHEKCSKIRQAHYAKLRLSATATIAADEPGEGHRKA